MDRRFGIVLIIAGLILLSCAVIFSMRPQNTEQKLVEAKLNEEQLQFLIKEMSKYLTPSNNINLNTTFSVKEMIRFAFSYTSYLDTDNVYVSIDEETQMGIIDAFKLIENINLIFGVPNVDLTVGGFKISENKVYVPLNLQGGDATIYKFKQRNVNNTTGIYITDIDCLEPTSPEDASSLLNKTEYDKDEVIYTLQIKYKYVDGRKVLLAYSTYSNLDY